MTEPVKCCTYQLPYLSDTKLIGCQTYQIPNLSDTEPIRYWTFQIPNLSNTKPFGYRTCQIPSLSDTEPCQIHDLSGTGPIRFWTYQIPNLYDNEPIRYHAVFKSLDDDQPLWAHPKVKSGPKQLHTRSMTPSQLTMTANFAGAIDTSDTQKLATKKSIPAPFSPPSSQWPPAPPSAPCGEIGDKKPKIIS
jgi:hypothetical protein